MSTSMCPCGSGKLFDDCCNRFLGGSRFATSAEELMRSRYSAFVMQNDAYIRETWHPTTRPATVDFVVNQQWTGLEINSTTGGQMLDSTGTVDFVAHYRRNGQNGYLKENSIFERLDGKWFYVDGEGDYSD